MSSTAEPASRATAALLADDEPAPFEVINADGAAPFLVVCDHASRRIPRALGDLGLPARELETHIAWDIGAGEVARRLAARFDAPLVFANYSRLVIDLNRALDDPTSIPVISDGVVIPGNRDLSDEAKRTRAEALFHPYHAAVAGMLETLAARGPAPAIVSVHSFTPVIKGEERPWHVGVLWDRDPRMALPFMARLGADRDVCVGDNLPYSGRDHYTFTMDHHAVRTGLPHLAMEIRYDLLLSEEGIAHWTGRIGDVIEEITADEDLYRVESF